MLPKAPGWLAAATERAFTAIAAFLAAAYFDIPGFTVAWNLEPPYPMPAAAANAANWAEGIDGDKPGVDDGCAVAWDE